MSAKTRLVLVLFLLAAAFLAGLNVGLYWPSIQSQQRLTLTPLNPSASYEATINIVAVQASDNVGVLNQAVVELRPGNGRVLFAINPFVEADTQQSAETAALVAQQLTGKSLKSAELIYSVKNTEAKLVGGPSAGAALTIATIAAIEKKTVRGDVAITGTIESNGKIGQVGGVIEKTTAAGQAGIKTFLVPSGQGKATYYEKKTTQQQQGRYVIQRTQYVPVSVDLNQFAMEQFGMQVIEVGSVPEAREYLIS